MTALLEHPVTTSQVHGSFGSILFEDGDKAFQQAPPEYFRDLNLDQVVDALVAGREEYDLKPFFYTRLPNVAGIGYRHEILRDLEAEDLRRSIAGFALEMHRVRQWRARAAKLYYRLQKERWLLEASEIYGRAVERLREDLGEAELTAGGWLRFREYLEWYVESERFQAVRAETRELEAALADIRYRVLIKGNRVTVQNRGAEIDYSAAVEETFAKFKQGAVKDYRVKFPESSDMNHVEARVLEGVATLHPETFRALEDFCARNGSYADTTIVRLDREVQFYLAWLEYEEKFRGAGLEFCYPRVSASRKEVSSRDVFDLALAGKLLRENQRVVCNDFHLQGDERIFVVTGPNQGGKTTFARTFGQVQHLASLGLRVPGTEARCFLFDRLFTHFEREENIETLRGKLQDDLVRIHHILEQATPESVIIINEIFASTTVQDAAFLSREIIERISSLDALGVCVTFLDELASLNEKTVSVVATIVPENPTLRTFKLERRPADGLSYAVALAEKYGLTYARLKARLTP